jgi:hypothetical protein
MENNPKGVEKNPKFNHPLYLHTAGIIHYFFCINQPIIIFWRPVCETIIAGDVNGNCKVDLKTLFFQPPTG